MSRGPLTWRVRAMGLMREELLRDMRLMGARQVSDLTRGNLRFRRDTNG